MIGKRENNLDNLFRKIEQVRRFQLKSGTNEETTFYKNIFKKIKPSTRKTLYAINVITTPQAEVSYIETQKSLLHLASVYIFLKTQKYRTSAPPRKLRTYLMEQ